MKNKLKPLDIKIVDATKSDSLEVTLNPYQFWVLIGTILFVGVLIWT
jgi:hypothetical protein